MPRHKPWIGRIPLILAELETPCETPTDYYTRPAVQRLFGIGRSSALELMRIAGATQARQDDPQTLAVSRVNLLQYVRYSPEAQEAMIEVRRRQKLAERLKEANEETKLRAVKLPVSSADEWCNLQQLPNVSIEPGMLRVAFSSTLDLMGDLYRLAKAAGNDWDAFLRACGETPSAKSGDNGSGDGGSGDAAA